MGRSPVPNFSKQHWSVYAWGCSYQIGVALADAAGMTEYQYNTGVVRSVDNQFRVEVCSGMAPWGDHVSIRTMEETPGNVSWRFAHFTPTQARLIAHHLLRKAGEIERNGQ